MCSLLVVIKMYENRGSKEAQVNLMLHHPYTTLFRFRFLKVEVRKAELQDVDNSFSQFSILRAFCASCLKPFTFNYRLTLVKIKGHHSAV